VDAAGERWLQAGREGGMGGARSREETRDEGGVWIAHMHGIDIFVA